MDSMTGFGRGTCENEIGSMTAEIKAVNSRFLEINMHSDHFSAFLEDKAARMVKASLHRGKINIFLSFAPFDTGRKWKVELDKSLLDAYVKALDKARRMKEIRPRRPVISDLLALPEPFLRVQQESISEEDLASLVEKAVEEALQGLLEMRKKEGNNLKQDLLRRLSLLQERREFLLSRQDAACKSHEERLRARIDKMLQDRDIAVDENRILEEVAIFSEKTDYTEEVVRLGSHLQQFVDMMESGEPVGRKLDFLLQEINREVNTTASKASDTEVVDCVIIIKTELEKIREQVQNIE